MPHEPISVFDMFKIGVGPSSSHTLGPWRAAMRCVDTIRQKGGLDQVASVTYYYMAHLAKTGKGMEQISPYYWDYAERTRLP
jgi:L-serine dehydratase